LHDEITAHGCHLKDVESGLVDFPTLWEGREVYLCWKLGVDAKFIRYPDSYHGRWTPWNVVHRYHHELLWWERYLNGP
ncbi:MAG TPA: DUF2203 family protein, partial [Vicinamibacteria bacterium]